MCPNTRLPGYFIAIQQGADYVEPDLVISQGRRAARAPRERDRRHDGCRIAPGIRRAQGDQDHRRRASHRLVHRGLHARGAEDAARARAAAGAAPLEHALRRRFRDPDVRRSARSRRGRGCAARRERARRGTAAAAAHRRSTRKPSTRATSRSSGCTSTTACSRRSRATATRNAPIPSACSPSRSQTSRRCAAALTCRWSSWWRPPASPSISRWRATRARTST